MVLIARMKFARRKPQKSFSRIMSVNRPKFKTIGELGKIFDGKPIEFSALLNRIELTVENRYSST